MASIDSPLTKFNRASQHFETLNSELSNLSNINSYVITKDIDSAKGDYVYRFDKVPPLPNGLDLLIGEILYNFRCSLDHLIWQFVLSEGNIPTTRNEFPIFNSIPEYEANKGSKLKGVSNAVVAIIDSLQPCYSAEITDHWWYLWYLQILSNTDKHRYLLVTRRSLGQKVRVSGTFSGTIRGNYLTTPVENGAVFFRTKSNVDVNLKPSILISFSNPPHGVRDLPILNHIKLIKASVGEVFSRLSPHIK